MESVESRPKRQAAKLAEEIIRQELAREEAKMQAQGKQSVPDSEKPDRSPEEQAAARSVTVLGGLFKCETATEDSQMIHDDEADLCSLCANVEWVKEFGPFKPGTLSNAVAINWNTGFMEVWDSADERVAVLQFAPALARALPKEEWPEEVLVSDYDEEDDEYDDEDEDDDGEDIGSEDELTEDEEEEEEEAEETDEEEVVTPKRKLSSGREGPSAPKKARK